MVGCGAGRLTLPLRFTCPAGPAADQLHQPPTVTNSRAFRSPYWTDLRKQHIESWNKFWFSPKVRICRLVGIDAGVISRQRQPRDTAGNGCGLVLSRPDRQISGRRNQIICTAHGNRPPPRTPPRPPPPRPPAHHQKYVHYIRSDYRCQCKELC